MRVLILQFPIGKIGGVKTSLSNLLLGFKELNIYTEVYNVSLNTKRLPKGKFVGFEKTEWLESYHNLVRDFDLIIWFTTCPHKLKSYQKEGWKQLFNIGKPQLAYIRDPYYEKYYSWYKEIPEKYKIKIICPWQHMLDSIKGLRAMKKIIPNAFASDKSSGKYREIKENLVIDANNWKLAKRKIDLIKAADRINSKIVSFGNQKELPFYLAKKEKNFNLVEHWGWQDRNVILEQMEKAKVVVDLLMTGTPTTFDHVIVEGISRGCVPITYLPSGCEGFKTIVTEPGCINCLAKKINNILSNFDDYNEMIESNLSNLSNLEPIKIVKQILEYVEEDYKINIDRGRLF